MVDIGRFLWNVFDPQGRGIVGIGSPYGNEEYLRDDTGEYIRTPDGSKIRINSDRYVNQEWEPYSGYSNAMERAYSQRSYGDGAGVMSAEDTRGVLDAIDAKDAEEQAKWSFISSLLGGGSGGGGGPSAASIQAAIDRIAEDYGRQIGLLTSRRDQGATSIADAMNMFRGNMAANNAQYNAASQQISDAIASRLAQSVAASQAQQAESARQADSLGWNGAAIQANAANNARAVQNSVGYQQDLADRYRQIQSASQNQTANAGELVNAGALGRLATNFQNAAAGLDQWRADAEYSARNPSTGGGGGGGGSRGSSVKEMSDALNLWDKMNPSDTGIDATTAYMYKMFEADPNGFAANPNYQQYLPTMGGIYADKLRRQLP